MSNNVIRVRSSSLYFLAGIFLLAAFLIIKIPALLDLLKEYLLEIIWCLSWAAIGIGFGLWNSRTDSEGRKSLPVHYYTYFVFVWFVASLVAFVAFGTFEKNIVRSYAAAALAGIVVGFVGDQLPDKLFGTLPTIK